MHYQEIENGIFFVEGEKSGRYPFANSLLIEGDTTVLIDTGMGQDQAAELSREKSVELVLISHGHEDHVSGNIFFEQAVIWSHKLDAPAVRSVERLVELYGAAGTEMEAGMEKFFRDFFNMNNLRVDMEFEDGHVFDLGSVKLEVMHTPGHSCGHCCFTVPDKGVVFLADIDLSSFGPWYGALDGDVDGFLESVEKIRNCEFEVAVSSHKGVYRGKREIRDKLDEFTGKIMKREELLIKFLERERTVEEIVEEFFVYGKVPDARDGGMIRLMERIMMEKHLERLSGLKRITGEGGNYKAV